MRITAIVVREWQEYLVRSRWFFFGLLFPSVVIMPLLFGGGDIRLPAEFAEQMAKVQAAEIPGVTPEMFLRVNQALLFLLITPVSFSLQFAVQGLMAEKQSGTLEPLLAAPVRTWELLLGKAIAAIVPGNLATWLGWALALAVIAVRMPAALPIPFLPSYLLQTFLATPLITVVGALVGLAIASRVGEARVAQQVAGFTQLPFFIGIFALVNSKIAVGPTFWLGFSALLFLLAVAALQMAGRIFARETILTRWR